MCFVHLYCETEIEVRGTSVTQELEFLFKKLLARKRAETIHIYIILF